jgi:hypothetical protein
MSTLSIRPDPDLERKLDWEVARLGTTRSRRVRTDKSSNVKALVRQVVTAKEKRQ